MDKVGLSSPWVTYFHKIESLFGSDEDIKIEYDNDIPEIKLFVADGEKAEVIAKLLPESETFGNVTLKIEVVPPNNESNNIEDLDVVELFKIAFKNNPVVNRIERVIDPRTEMEFDYVVFKKEVVQFFDDNLGDINGNCSTLNEYIARDVFSVERIFFCTDNN